MDKYERRNLYKINIQYLKNELKNTQIYININGEDCLQQYFTVNIFFKVVFKKC